MSEFKNRNDYSVSAFSSNGFLIKIQYCNQCYDAIKWLDSSNNYKNWLYFNVYARRTGRYLCRVYKGKPYINKPK